MEELRIVTDLSVKLLEKLKGRIRAGMYIVPKYDEVTNDYVIYVNLYNTAIPTTVYKFTNMLEKIRFASASDDLIETMARYVYDEYRANILRMYFK